MNHRIKSLILLSSAAFIFSAVPAASQSYEFRYTPRIVSEGVPGGPIDPGEPADLEQCANPVTGGMLEHGQAVTAFLSATVPWSGACQSEARVCDDGSLTGSYLFPSCIPVAAVGCALPWGGSIGHGEVATAWAQATVVSGQSCISEDRFCSDGALSGTFANEACVVEEDTDPDPFAFGTNSNALPNALNLSNVERVQGITGNVPVSIVDPSSEAAFRICATANCSTVVADWRVEDATIQNGQYLQVRQRTSGSPGGSTSLMIAVGSFSTAFSQTTTMNPCGGAGRLCDDGTVYLGINNGLMLATTRCDAGQAWNGTSCAGTAIKNAYFGPAGTAPSPLCTNAGQSIPGCLDGETNTALIAAQGSDFAAATYCATLVQDGYDDWYLPAIRQVMHFSSVPNTTGAFQNSLDKSASSYYQSSSELSVNQVHIWRATTATVAGHNKGSSFAVGLRCVRTM